MPFYPHYLLLHIVEEYAKKNYNSWEVPNISYDAFVTGVTESYNHGDKYDKFYSDYVARYFDDRITGGTAGGVHVTGGTANSANSTLVFTNTSGASFTVTNSALLFNDAYVSGGTLNTTTGVVTFINTSGGTFAVSGFTGFTSYWSANTDSSISPSGLTTYVGIGTDAPEKILHVKTDENTVAIFESEDATVAIKITDGGGSGDDAYIVGKSSVLYISDQSGSPSGNAAFAFDYVNGKLGVGTGTPNVPLTVVGDISGTTDLYISGNTNISGDTSIAGDIYSGTTNLLDLFCVTPCDGGTSYWSANTDGSISPSGLTTHVGIGTQTPNSRFEVKELIKFLTGSSQCGTYIGYKTGDGHEVDSQYNTAVGYHSIGSLGTLDEAIRNTAIGNTTLAHLTTGDGNTAVGSEANQNVTTGSENIAIGDRSGFRNVEGSGSIAIGNNSLYYGPGILTIKEYGLYANTAIGHWAMENGIYQRYNTSVGYGSLQGPFAAAGGTGTTAIGYGANSANTSGSWNTTLGYQAGDNITSGDYNISIGPNSDPPSATADYQMNIGGIIHGNDEYSESKIANVGIGYNDPKTVLDVHHSGSDLTSMAVNTGGGEVIYFGINDPDGEQPLGAGKLMYLDVDFNWKYAAADTVETGGSQLLALGLGTTVEEGLLIRGFFHFPSDEIQGVYDEGLPCYISEVAGAIDFTAPSAESAVVRVVGYAISSTSDEIRVVYFTPDNTWVELS